MSVKHNESVPVLGVRQADHVDGKLRKKVDSQITPPLLLSAGLDPDVAVRAAPQEGNAERGLASQRYNTNSNVPRYRRIIR